MKNENHDQRLKRTGLMFLFFSFVSSVLLFAQSNFDQDAAVFHKKAIMLCAAVKNPTPSLKQIDTLLSKTSTELMMLSDK